MASNTYAQCSTRHSGLGDGLLALKRSTARNIFAIGSLACLVALVLLTLDFESVVAKRTNEAEAMTDQVVRG